MTEMKVEEHATRITDTEKLAHLTHAEDERLMRDMIAQLMSEADELHARESLLRKIAHERGFNIN
jgi:hypothetical protein